VAVHSVEDIFQWVFDSVAKAIRLRLIHGGAREHEEQLAVATNYAAGTNKVEFSSPKRFVRIVTSVDMFWVDSAADDTDAGTKLTTAGSRGVVPAMRPYDLALSEGITRLDFLAISTAGSVFVTGLD
jgi:hypothetical protein